MTCVVTVVECIRLDNIIVCLTMCCSCAGGGGDGGQLYSYNVDP